VLTIMFEISSPQHRDRVLSELGHVEDSIRLDFGEHSVVAENATEHDLERTTADGKTSAVHFLRFAMRPEQVGGSRCVCRSLLSVFPCFSYYWCSPTNTHYLDSLHTLRHILHTPITLQVEAFLSTETAQLSAHHPKYMHAVTLPPETLHSLRKDLLEQQERVSIK
jgi:Protein of unknown function (DUF3501)